jgi:hypothetical protein
VTFFALIHKVGNSENFSNYMILFNSKCEVHRFIGKSGKSKFFLNFNV